MAATWLALFGRAPVEVAGRTEEQCHSALNSTCGAPNVSETVLAVEWAIPAELSSSWWECSVQGPGCNSKFNGCAECFCIYVSDRHEDLCHGTSSGLRVAARRAVVLVMAVVGSSLAAWACIACVRNEGHRTLTSERQAIAARFP